MSPFEVAQSFIECCRAGTPVATVSASFRRAIEALGFRHFACCSHVDPLHPPRGAVVLHNYPAEWTRAFSQLNFHSIDPVFHFANQQFTPFFWDSEAFRAALTPVQRGILSEAQRFGVAHGYTVPIHPPRTSYAFRGSCSVVPDSALLGMGSFFAVQLMGVYMYEALSRESQPQQARPLPPSLTTRERQCLELAAQGKSDWASGRILGISERTVHNHIEHAKRRLGVATRVQAIVHALVSRQISFGDVIRSGGQDWEPGDRTK